MASLLLDRCQFSALVSRDDRHYRSCAEGEQAASGHECEAARRLVDHACRTIRIVSADDLLFQSIFAAVLCRQLGARSGFQFSCHAGRNGCHAAWIRVYGAGGILAWIVEKVNGLLFAVVTWCSELRLFQTIWPSPTVGWMVFYYGGLAGLVWLGLQRKQQVESASEDSGPMLDSVLVMHWKTRLHRWNRRVLLPGAVIGLGLVLWVGYRPLQEYSRQGKVQFIDVGQGDSILIHSPGEARHILVDGGGTVSFRKPGNHGRSGETHMRSAAKRSCRS